MDNERIIVFDFGSGLFRCGEKTDRKPFRYVVDPNEPKRPDILGMNNFTEYLLKIKKCRGIKILETLLNEKKLCFVGREEIENEFVNLKLFDENICSTDEDTLVSLVKYRRCISHGKILDFEKVSTIINDSLCHGGFGEHWKRSILLTESPVVSNSDRVKLMEIIFEEQKLPKLSIGLQTQFAMFTSGLTTGLVLDIGKELTHITPVHELLPHKDSTIISLFGGRVMTEYLQNTLCERGYDFSSCTLISLIENIKETMCRCHCKPSTESWSDLMYLEWEGRGELEYDLPDGSKMTIGEEIQRTPEIMFRPSLTHEHPFFRNTTTTSPTLAPNNSSSGCFDNIAKLVLKSIHLYPKLHQKEKMFQNIVLSGGSTSIYSFKEKLELEMRLQLGEQQQGSRKKKISISENLDGANRNWKGAANYPKEMLRFASKSEYEDFGGLPLSMKKWRSLYEDEGDVILSSEDLKVRIQFVINEYFVTSSSTIKNNMEIIFEKNNVVSLQKFFAPKILLLVD